MSPRPFIAITGACALAATTAVPMVAGADPAPAPAAQITMRHNDADGVVSPAQKVIFSGKVTHPNARQQVALQWLRGEGGADRKWVTVDTVRRDGRRYRLAERVPSRDLGAASFRTKVATRNGSVASKAVRLQVTPPAGSVGASNTCAEAYKEHTNYHNICASFDNQTHTFLSPGVAVGNTLNLRMTGFDGGDSEWYHHAVITPSDLGDTTWAYSSSQQSTYAHMRVNWAVQTPAENISLNAMEGMNGTVSNRCDGATYTACVQTSDWGWIDGDRLLKLSNDMVNAPVLIRIDNNTGQTVSWRSRPTTNAITFDADGSSESVPGLTEIASGDSYFIAGYRKVTGVQALANFSLQFPDTSHDSNGITHVMNVAAQLTPDTTKGTAATWPVNTGGSTCVDRPIGGDSGLQAPCSIDWSGTGQWGSVATMTVTLNNRF